MAEFNTEKWRGWAKTDPEFPEFEIAKWICTENKHELIVEEATQPWDDSPVFKTVIVEPGGPKVVANIAKERNKGAALSEAQKYMDENPEGKTW